VAIPGQGTAGMQAVVGLAFRFLLVVDVEGFSQRYAAEQARIQDDLEYAMSQAAAGARLDRKRWYRQPRGDGELAVLPPGTNGLSLVADFPPRLASMLARVNRTASARSRLRARVAIHHGTVAPGQFGLVGAAPVVVSRLADASMLRHQLRQRADIDIALIVSGAVYNEVIQSRFHNLNPEAFCRTSVRSKGVSYVGYLYQGTFATEDSKASAAPART
jgi:hypothetical protein